MDERAQSKLTVLLPLITSIVIVAIIHPSPIESYLWGNAMIITIGAFASMLVLDDY